MKNITVLGSTGSIGTQTLQIAENDENINICALAAKSSVKLLAEQVRRFRPDIACIADEEKYSELVLETRDLNTKIVCGDDGMAQCAAYEKSDSVLNSVVGIAGLMPTMSAVKAKKRLLLANKETLVCAGEIVMSAARENGVDVIPVDSEHSAIFQCINGEKKEKVKNIWLTASGGPFFGKTREELENKTKEDALKHPNWTMGAKITIDSATLMNKGLEIIEARHLFGVDIDNIIPVIHRQSIIHSMVEFCDGSYLAQLGSPDMRLPISYAINYPERKPSFADRLDIFKNPCLTFDKPDFDTFKCLNLAVSAYKKGGVCPAVLNGANEAAVDLFLNGKIKFLDIADLVEDALAKFDGGGEISLEKVLCADKEARNIVYEKGLSLC